MSGTPVDCLRRSAREGKEQIVSVRWKEERERERARNARDEVSK